MGKSVSDVSIRVSGREKLRAADGEQPLGVCGSSQPWFEMASLSRRRVPLLQVQSVCMSKLVEKDAGGRRVGHRTGYRKCQSLM